MLKKLREEHRYWRKTGVTALARRYFVMNSFDGILTTMGILSGAYIGGINDTRLVLTMCLSAGIAIAFSGAWGAFFTEQAERALALRKLDETILEPDEKKALRRAHKSASYFVAAVDGLSPLMATLIVASPFAFLDATHAYRAAFAIAAACLFLLGVGLGRISKENLVVSGMKMLFAGIATVLIGFFLLGGRA